MKLLLERVKNETVMFNVSYLDKNGNTVNAYGYGFIINEQYLATCYHEIVRPEQGVIFDHVEVKYDEQTINKTNTYKTVKAYRVFQPKEGQYDFSKHNYDPKDHLTDFVVFKLQHKIPVKNIEPDLAAVSTGDKFYALGGSTVEVNVNYKIEEKFSEFEYLFSYNESAVKQSAFFGLLGKGAEGFSGSLAYRPDGKVIGMFQFGFTNFPKEQLDYHVLHGMPIEMYQQIEHGYGTGNKLLFAIDIDYLYQRYLKGYLNDK